MTTQIAKDFLGTMAEALVFGELIRLRKRPGLDFTFQSSNMGGRVGKGGLSIDFLFADPPFLAMNVRSPDSSGQRSDIMTKAQLASEGITLIFLDEDMIEQDVQYVVGEALRYRDVSRR